MATECSGDGGRPAPRAAPSGDARRDPAHGAPDRHRGGRRPPDGARDRPAHGLHAIGPLPLLRRRAAGDPARASPAAASRCSTLTSRVCARRRRRPSASSRWAPRTCASRTSTPRRRSSSSTASRRWSPSTWTRPDESFLAPTGVFRLLESALREGVADGSFRIAEKDLMFVIMGAWVFVHGLVAVERLHEQHGGAAGDRARGLIRAYVNGLGSDWARHAARDDGRREHSRLHHRAPRPALLAATPSHAGRLARPRRRLGARLRGLGRPARHHRRLPDQARVEAGRAARRRAPAGKRGRHRGRRRERPGRQRPATRPRRSGAASPSWPPTSRRSTAATSPASVRLPAARARRR